MRAVFRYPTLVAFLSDKPHPTQQPGPRSCLCSPPRYFSPMKQSLQSRGEDTVHASPMRSMFVSDRPTIPRHSSSFHSHVSSLLAILQMMSPSAHRMFLGFLEMRSLSNDSANCPSTGTTIAGMTHSFSARRTPDSRALTGDSYWPSLTTYNMRPLSASPGDMKPLIVLYRKNLYSAPIYAFLVPLR